MIKDFDFIEDSIPCQRIIRQFLGFFDGNPSVIRRNILESMAILIDQDENIGHLDLPLCTSPLVMYVAF